MADLKKIQTNSFWPKMLGSIALSLVFFGIIASIVDNRIIQPWQKKIFEKRGTTAEVIAPSYWSLIPGGLTLAATMSDKIAPKFVQKMGYLGRFAFSGTLALGVYTASTLMLIHQKLKHPPKTMPNNIQPAMHPEFGATMMMGPPLRHPQAFRQFEQHTRNAG